MDSRSDSSTSHSIITYIEFFGSFTSWPTISSFTVELGEEKIVEYVTTWYYEENWLYCIDFILQQSDEVSDFYTYEVKVLENSFGKQPYILYNSLDDLYKWPSYKSTLSRHYILIIEFLVHERYHDCDVKVVCEQKSTK